MILATCLALLTVCPGWLVEINFEDIKFLGVQKNTFEDEYINDEEEIKQLKTSPAAIEFIKKLEDAELEAYDDGTGTWTIGYGHTGRASGKPVKEGMVITKEQAVELLYQDLQEFEKNVFTRMNTFNAPMSQREFDYLIVATFNRGNDITGQELYDAVSKRDQGVLKKLMMKTIEGSDPKVMDGLIKRVNEELDFLFDLEQYTPVPTTIGPVDIPTTTTTTMPTINTNGQNVNVYMPGNPEKDKSKLDEILEGFVNVGIQFQDMIDKALGKVEGQPTPKYGYLGEKIKMKFDEWNK